MGVRRVGAPALGGYTWVMRTAHVLGVALAIACVAALCLLSVTTATIVGAVTLVAVGIDGLCAQPRPARATAPLIDLSTRDYLEIATGHDR